MKKLLVGAALMFSYVMAQAQTVDEIVDKSITAMGGKENIDKIKSIVMDGAMSVQGNNVNITVTKVQGKLFRTDMSMMGMNGFTLVTDKEGWGFMPFMGQTKAEAMTADQIKSAQGDLDIGGPFYNYKEKGTTLTLNGEEDVAGSKCYVIKATDKNGNASTYYVNDSTYLLARTKKQAEMMGQKMDVAVDFMDYKDIEGVKMPFSLTQQFGTVVFSSIKVNTPIDEKLYKPE